MIMGVGPEFGIINIALTLLFNIRPFLSCINPFPASGLADDLRPIGSQETPSCKKKEIERRKFKAQTKARYKYRPVSWTPI